MPQTAPATVAEFCTLLVQSRLLNSEAVKSTYDRWQSEASADKIDQVDAFRRWLVRARLVTEYQAALLNRGHTDGFFLNDYVITERLGRGRMAGVYKARHPSGQEVAIKVLSASRAKEPNLLNRFQREAKLATQLDHLNIVRAFDYGQAKNVHFIVMEYLDGETVGDALERREKLPPAEAARIARQTLQGLQQVHEKGMVHRDIKPANLMLVPPGTDTTLGSTVKILDIGLGRLSLVQPGDPDQITRDGVLLGTPDYLAPEQAKDARSADIRADIYSVGCVLYHMITGRTPFPDTNVIKLAMRHANEPPKPLREAAGEVPEGLQAAVDRMMAKDPADRFQTPDQAAEALAPFVESAGRTEPPRKPGVTSGYQRFLRDGGSHQTVPVGTLKSEAAKPRNKPGTVTAPAPPPRAEADGDVELVPIPPPPEELDKGRPLTDLTRRDAIMLGIGGGGVLGAILAGYGLSRLVRRKKPDAE